jgi:hypothetical protein
VVILGCPTVLSARRRSHFLGKADEIRGHLPNPTPILLLHDGHHHAYFSTLNL